MTKHKGVIYYRVSTEDQAQSGVSLEQQKNACLEYASKNNIEIVEIFHDDGVSAKTTERLGLQALLKYSAKNAKSLDYVIVYKIDRLSRNVNDYTGILVMLNKYEIKLASITEAIDNSSSGRFIGNIMAATAQFDNDVKSERVASCMLEKVKQGVWCWKAPLGYLNARDDRNRAIITTDPERLPYIKMAFEKFATGLYQMEEVRKEINQAGFKTWRGLPVNSQTMHKILTEKFYIGIMTTKGKEYPGTHETVIDENTFYRCQKIIKHADKGTNIAFGLPNELFPLRNFLLCSDCGRPLTACLSRGKMGVKYPYYRCYNKDCKALKSISKLKIEEQFNGYLNQITPKANQLEAFKQILLDVYQDQQGNNKNNQENLVKQIVQLKAEKDKLIEMKTKDLLDDEDFKSSMDKIKSQLAEKQAVTISRNEDEFDLKANTDVVFDVVSSLADFYEESGYYQKLKLQSLIFKEKPRFNFTENQTRKLSLILQIEKEPCGSISSRVAARRIELRLTG